jgi:hypothetical protein
MAYPRQCPLCDAAYGPASADDARHTTARSVPGGTPSPWRPELPGRLLVLACHECGGEYAWDSFAGRPMLEARDLPARRPLRPARPVRPPLRLRHP